MVKKSAFVRFLPPSTLVSLLLLVTLLGGCGTDREEPPRLKLDEAYLESDAYQRFKRSLDREKVRSTDERELINQAVAKVLSRTPSQLSLPVRFTTENLAAYTGSSSRILLKSAALNSSVYGKYSYYPVGKTLKGDLTVLFFLLRRNSTPDIEIDLMVATVESNGTVRSARSIAPFHQAVTGNRIHSEVEISSELRIVSRIHDAGNAIVASASVEYRDFQVRPDGRIVEATLER